MILNRIANIPFIRLSKTDYHLLNVKPNTCKTCNPVKGNLYRLCIIDNRFSNCSGNLPKLKSVD